MFKIDWPQLTDDMGCLSCLDQAFNIPVKQYIALTKRLNNNSISHMKDNDEGVVSLPKVGDISIETAEMSSLDDPDNDIVICHQLSQMSSHEASLDIYALAVLPIPLKQSHPPKIDYNQVWVMFLFLCLITTPFYLFCFLKLTPCLLISLSSYVCLTINTYGLNFIF